MAPTEDAWGDNKSKKIVGGSDLCGMALWQWVFTRMEPQKSRPKNWLREQLGRQMDQEKGDGRPLRLVRSRISSKAARLLFKELVNNI